MGLTVSRKSVENPAIRRKRCYSGFAEAGKMAKILTVSRKKFLSVGPQFQESFGFLTGCFS